MKIKITGNKNIYTSHEIKLLNTGEIINIHLLEYKVVRKHENKSLLNICADARNFDNRKTVIMCI